MSLSPWPPVSVVMPVLNEERHLEEAVGRVLDQEYPGELEVVLAIGPSKDRTQEIADRLAEADKRITIVANPSGKTPSGLNTGIAHARHDIVVRVDGHGVLTQGYITRAVEVLHESGADNVGGVMAAEGRTPIEMAVACAYRSRLGLGASTFHQGGKAGPADTVYLGVFRRAALERVGGFDETMHRAQDWELNYRIRKTGGLIWFSPDLSVTYRPRSSLQDVAKQFFHTGQWRREVIRRHPETANKRYLAPPVAVILLALGTILGIIGLATGISWLDIGFLAPLGYALLLLVGSAMEGRYLPWKALFWLPLVCATMHVSWGLGFLIGLQERPVPPAATAPPATA
ncbi:cellulose synthase/poly-beta-1,6-N-acetylglucosamine synthase-like glycosyltransferase [Kribbella orskensis]|uniref:Cellulose synthase/poly-beta-1,6-N-acetylglucosamine synthase-like glycosyltransferase n=1 Tax=Kribbella orskensis TaxID=2512216 RepID=A0ABY2BVC5_9ACTN|nr:MULTISPECIES: glycosyltransferase family 2 protein [Kribbella]TCN44244.1 cellulose synthase/poly-beta-1,6-N-acetylglucosamine synthase-like glycosyltransferase [Kribbella sp. VKM Ac-2500]TCO31978.1 cellulose synthase/poly-beta-1,6-N-acetylglucosamine synthase-like glycosyltransferase [Kribbella orskensis]